MSVENMHIEAKRPKFRTISGSLELLISWRHLYNGVYEVDPKTGQRCIYSYSLNEAAQMLGLSKKSLDDYLLQVRHGLKRGFDFERHKNRSIGFLRDFIKENR